MGRKARYKLSCIVDFEQNTEKPQTNIASDYYSDLIYHCNHDSRMEFILFEKRKIKVDARISTC